MTTSSWGFSPVNLITSQALKSISFHNSLEFGEMWKFFLFERNRRQTNSLSILRGIYIPTKNAESSRFTKCRSSLEKTIYILGIISKEDEGNSINFLNRTPISGSYSTVESFYFNGNVMHDD